MLRPLPCLLLLTASLQVHAQTQNALDFDGVDDEVNIANASALIAGQGSFSMACRVYPTQSANWPNMEAFAGFRDNALGDFYLLQTYGTTMEGRFRNSANSIFTLDSVGLLQLNTWQLVALTYDGSMLRMYHNADPIDSVAANGTISTTAGMFRIGNMPIPGSTQIFLDGRVDEIGLWKRALLPEEIQCLVGGSADLADPDLVLYYGCDQGTPGGDNTTISTLTDGVGTTDGQLLGFAMNGTGSNFVEGAGFGSSTSGLVCPGEGFLFNGLEYTAGSYTFTYTSSLGCDSIITLEVSEIPVNVGVNATSTTLTSLNGSASWQWLDCDNGFAEIPGASFQTYTPSANGSYAVELTDEGCVDTSACYDFTSIGLKELDAQLPARLVPTVTNGPLRLLLDAPTGLLAISITDVRGREVMRSRASAKAEQRIDVSSLGNGVYHLWASTPSGSRVLRFVRE